jgi:hypothetical protein
MENHMKGYGWYFIVVGIVAIVTAFARAKKKEKYFSSLPQSLWLSWSFRAQNF